jgi:hypothetical protein
MFDRLGLTNCRLAFINGQAADHVQQIAEPTE